MHPVLTAARLAGVLALLAFLLTGCLDLRSTLTIEADNTVDGELLLLADKAELEQHGTAAETFATWRAQLPDLPRGDESVYDQGGRYGTRISFADTSFDQFNQNQTLKLRREGSRVSFVLPLDPANYVRADRSLEDTRSLLAAMRIEVSVRMPGKVDRHNGSLTGRTVGWQLEKGTDLAELRAESVIPPSPKPSRAADRSPGGGGFPWQLAGGAALVALGLALAVVAWRRRA